MRSLHRVGRYPPVGRSCHQAALLHAGRRWAQSRSASSGLPLPPMPRWSTGGSVRDVESVVADEEGRGRRAADVRVIVGMSGGVDSSISALLLKRRGFTVQGAYMLNWDPQEEDEHGRCRSDEDYADAKKVCSHLDIPLHKVEFIREYWTDVFSPSMAAYEAGYTPNPDVLCNREIKFKRFLQLCSSRFHADYIATGHYARLWRLPTGLISLILFHNPLTLTMKEGRTYLMRGADKTKDQSYFLSNIVEDALLRSIFPVGHMTKREVKELAQKEGLGWLTEKKSSSGICFIGKRRFSQFVDKYITPTAGHFQTLDGTILGQHEGITKYTIGQRARIPGRLESSKLYVVDKRIEENAVIVAEGSDHPALLTDSLYASDVHWISGIPDHIEDGSPFECEYQIGHLRNPARCIASMKTDDGAGRKLHVRFIDRPHWGVAPHQVISFYQGPICLGGGIIQESGPSYWRMHKAVPTEWTV